MDPVIDETAHAIQRIPQSTDEIQVGDIISYEYGENIVIHRVVETGNDGEWFARTRGDNNAFNDPQKVRFDQVKRILVAIIY